jgi:hypothetical protein
MEERVVIDQLDGAREHVVYPDVRVYQDPDQPYEAVSSHAATGIAEPIILELEVESRSETYITIVNTDGEQLVTTIEFLSRTNKLPGDGRDQYRRKRSELLAAQVNVVEVDLVRAGSWKELLLPHVAPARVQSAYRVVNRRVHPKPRVELYPISLRQRLPIIPIPLRSGDADVVLDLQKLVEQAYDNGRYDRTRYDRPCDPPLEGEDAQWAEQRIAAR